MLDFQGQVAVVTGAASGIGEAMADGFAAEGMAIVAADIDASGASGTAGRVVDAGGRAIGVGVDVADEDSVAALADRAFEEFGQVDLLLNNAGVFQAGFSWERSAADWEWVFGVNVFGIIHAIRHFIPRMIAQDTVGHVVNTASVAAFVGGATSGPYVVSKCAAFATSEALAYDLQAAGSKIGVSVLCPSSFDTAISKAARNRPDRFGHDDTADAAAVNEGLAAMTATGLAPGEVMVPLLEGIRSGDFVIPTKPSYRAQIENRFEALLERRLPGPVIVD